MASQTEIVNNGLERVGAETITDINEGSDNANVASTIYDLHRRKTLRRHPWNFATKRIKLARSATTPPFEYDYQYPIPSDFLRVVRVSDNTDGTGYVQYQMAKDATDGRVLLCSATDVYLRYVADVTDTQQFDDMFAWCLALSMGTIFAIKIAQSRSLSADITAELNRELRAARGVDSQEDFPEPLPEGSWVTSRHSGADWGA